VVHRVADQVDDRIGQVLDHRLVDFGLLADQHQFDILAQVAGEVAGDARVLLEQAADRLHAGLHHRVLQVGDQQVELAYRLIQRVQGLGVGAAIEDVRAQRIQAVLGQADFAGKIEHLVEARGIDPDRIVARLLGIAAAHRHLRAGLVGWHGGRRRHE
jgi:hypothetical protein